MENKISFQRDTTPGTWMAMGILIIINSRDDRHQGKGIRQPVASLSVR
jgi:hypothetical protein